MDSISSRRLEVFALWLKALPADVRGLAAVLTPKEPEAVRVNVAAGLVYLARNLDLIPDGIEGIGYLDDAFVLRTSAALAFESVGPAPSPVLRRLAADNAEVVSFLGADYTRFREYVIALRHHRTKGHTVTEIATTPALARDLVAEVQEWCGTYRESPLQQDAAELYRLKSFLHAKLALVRTT